MTDKKWYVAYWTEAMPVTLSDLHAHAPNAGHTVRAPGP